MRLMDWPFKYVRRPFSNDAIYAYIRGTALFLLIGLPVLLHISGC